MRNKAKTPISPAKTPRPQCGNCQAWQVPAGCGYLASGMPCRHTIERRRFEAVPVDVIVEEPAPEPEAEPVPAPALELEQLPLF